MRYLTRAFVPVAIIAIVLCALSGLGPLAPTARAAAAISSPGCGQWTVVSGANPNTYDDSLTGVAAVSANDVWAVGSMSDPIPGPTTTLVEHWNGTAWSLVPSPNGPNASQSNLTSVAAISPTDVWAVGWYVTASSGPFTLTEHWNGSSWSVIPSPNVGLDDNFTSASAVSSSDVWAVGYYYDQSLGFNQTLIEHWDGKSWSTVTDGASGMTAANLQSVTTLSSTDAWAVGWYSPSGARNYEQTLIEHWNGTNWTVVSSPNSAVDENLLESVSASGPANVWAVGSTFDQTTSQTTTFTEHWNGTNWSMMPSYAHGANNLAFNSVVAVPRGSLILAVGAEYTSANTVTLAVRLNGASGIRMQTPNPSSQDNELYGVAAVSATNAWAVGLYDAGNSQYRVLIEHYQAPLVGILCP